MTHYHRQALELSKEVGELTQIIEKKFKTNEGPFYGRLERSLMELGVERQAYQGGTFVGNHVHTLLKLKSIEHLTGELLKESQGRGDSMEQTTKDMVALFKRALQLFAERHNIYNKKILTHEDITTLESGIPRFMEHYRTSFPHASIIPKMHLLEDHVLPWVKRWRVGSGLMEEQGAEQIHAHIHHLERVYSGIRDLLKRLKYIMHEHMLQTAPSLNTLQPPIKKRKKTEN